MEKSSVKDETDGDIKKFMQFKSCVSGMLPGSSFSS